MTKSRCIVATFLLLVAAASSAQTYPTRQVRLIVGFVAGSGTDLAARVVAQRLPEHLGQPVLVENRPGAGGAIAAEQVVRSAPDGHTLLMTAAADAVQPAIRKKMPFDVVRDLAPVTPVVAVPFLLVVHPVVPVRTAADLIAVARARPEKLNYASSGIGSSAHLAHEHFNSMAKLRIVHVPYKGSPEAITAVLSGQVDMGFTSVPPAQPLIDSGRLRALAISSDRRIAAYPDIPTVAESGLPGYRRVGWFGVSAPAGTSRDIVGRLNAAIVKIVATPDVRDGFNRQGLLPMTSTPEEFAAFIREEVAQNVKLVQAAGASAQ